MAVSRRLRSTAAARIDERLHRFLKPGALARLRDTRISARSPRSAPLPRLSPPSSPLPASAAAAGGAAHQIDGFPCFVSKIHGPRLPQRKKLVAAKSIYFVPGSPELAESFLDAFGVDLVAAH